MARHPLHDVAIAGVYNTRQARVLESQTAETVMFDAVDGVLADAGVGRTEVDGIAAGGPDSSRLVYDLGLGPAWRGTQRTGVPMVLEAAGAIIAGQCDTVVVVGGAAGVYTERESTAPWTRPHNEFVVSWGLFTAAEFALVARRHMEVFGTTPEQLATVAATIRNNGHVNPDAVYHGRGPFTPEDILGSRLVAEPFHVLDCATTSEGGCAVLLTTAERARDMAQRPVYLLGGASDSFGPSYQFPPSFDLTGRDPDEPNGWVGRNAARRSFATAGISPSDVNVFELYDPFSFEIIRQFEAFGFCGPGEGGDFVTGGSIEVGGRFPITTDGGTMSFSHPGSIVQLLQRVARGALQLRGTCRTGQVPGAEVAMCTNGGAGALFTDVLLMGSHQP